MTPIYFWISAYALFGAGCGVHRVVRIWPRVPPNMRSVRIAVAVVVLFVLVWPPLVIAGPPDDDDH